jgi:hypothetical protein
MKPTTCSLALLFIASILLSACDYPGERTTPAEISPPSEKNTFETYPVDPVFTEFYDYLGGESVLGQALTPLILSESKKSQYVEAGLMVYDPLATESERHQLAPLGNDFGFLEPPVEDPGDPGLRYIDGHIVYPEFVPFYDRLGGAQFVGRPLTEARHNPEKNRIEQYFENLGFYRLDWDEPGKVRLIAYGAYACDERCRYQVPSASIPARRGFLPEPFASSASKLGLNLLGRTLSEPHLAADGHLEVIFENVVLVMGPQAEEEAVPDEPTLIPRVWLPLTMMDQAEVIPLDLLRIPEYYWLPVISNQLPSPEGEIVRLVRDVFLRPIVAMLGIPSSPPVKQIPGSLMAFFPVEGDLGFHIPLYFMDWLEENGGIEISGPPSGEAFPVNGGVFRQCFTNLCLDFDPQAPEGQQLHPAPLGVTYKEKFFQLASGFQTEQSLEGVSLQAWEEKPYILPREMQEIHILIEEAGVPLANREPVLTLTLADNSQQAYPMKPTDEHGQTSVQVGPIQAPNGTLIAYEACLSRIDGQKLCVQDHFLVWED